MTNKNIMVAMALQIGDKVKWTVGKIVNTGVVYEDKGDVVLLLTHFINNIVDHREIEVSRELLTLNY